MVPARLLLLPVLFGLGFPSGLRSSMPLNLYPRVSCSGHSRCPRNSRRHSVGVRSQVLEKVQSSMTQTLRKMTRRQMFFGILGSGVALSLWRHRDGPPTFTDPNGILWTKSKGGEPLAIFKDEKGRIYMIDKYGNLYYDTGSPESGFFIVERNGNMINLRIDQNGELVRAPVGNIADLRSFKISSSEENR